MVIFVDNWWLAYVTVDPNPTWTYTRLAKKKKKEKRVSFEKNDGENAE